MSKTVDERIVSMKFDNKNFEGNVKNTMSTLEKLKQSLKFKGASKGLENISSAAKKVDFSQMSNGIEHVRNSFSALEVMGITTLANLTNSAVNAGKKMISALTLDPITTGFQEYETQINAVQTILANTQSKGTTLDQVNAALDELNTYADKTIYNFTEMTRNIGTFTAAGVDLDKSVTSIKGIANLAAVSGSTSQQASTAMYQLSQALAAGKVQLMDWNSVVNAGMGGEVFQNALKRTARNMGIAVDEIIEQYGSFRESLTKGEWLTSDVLTETLTQLSGAYDKATLLQKGYTEEQANDILNLAQTAVDAATKVKTFTQLWDTLKEAAQSGWTQTWEILIGDFEEAKELLTGISDTVGGFIGKVSDSRNKLLEGAFSSGWKKLSKEISKTGIDMNDFKNKLVEVGKKHKVVTDEMIQKAGSFEKSLKSGWASPKIVSEALKSYAGGMEGISQSTEEMNQKLEHFQKVVNEVWNGDYKNGQQRVEALTKAGYDYATVQDLVNKTVDGHKLKIEDLTDAQAANLGFTEEQIKMLRQLSDQAEKTGTPFNKLIQDLSRKSGRELVCEGIANILSTIGKLLGAVGKAWRDAFPPMSSDTLYNILEGFYNFTQALTISDRTINNLTRTLKGLFAILDIVSSIFGGGLKLAFKVVTKVVSELWKALGFANANILEITATVGDAIVAFRNWYEEHSLINKAIEITVPLVVKLIEKIVDLVKEIGKLPQVQNGISKLKEVFLDIAKSIEKINPDAVLSAFSKLGSKLLSIFGGMKGSMSGIGGNIIDGLTNGLGDGVAKVISIITDIATSILETVKGILGIHSPSREMHEVGKNTIDGLLNGLQEGAGKIGAIISKIANMLIQGFSAIPWGKVFAVLLSAGIFHTSNKWAGVLKTFAEPLEGLGSIFGSTAEVIERSAKPIAKTIKNFSKVLKGFYKVLGAYAFKMKAQALVDVAKAIAILAGSLWVISKIEPDRLWQSVGAIAALAGILGVLALAIGKMKGFETINLAGFAMSLIGLSVGLLLIVSAVKKMGTMDPSALQQGLIGLGTIIIGLGALFAAMGYFLQGGLDKSIDKASKTILKISFSILLLTFVMKMVAKMDAGDMTKGLFAITAFVGIIALLSKITKMAGRDIDKLGSTLIKMSITMMLLVYVIKMVSKLEPEEVIKGMAGILAFIGILKLMTLVVKVSKGDSFAKLGGVLMSMSISLLLLVGAVKLISMLEPEEIAKGALSILVFVGIMKLMIEIVKYDGQIAKVATTMIALSLSIAILAAVAIALSLIDPKDLAKGIIAVGMLGAVMAMMIVATRGANDCKANLIVMTVAIGILAGALFLLSGIEPSRLLGASAALGILMGMFGVMSKLSSKIGASFASLIMMVGVVALLAGVLAMLSALKVQSVLGSATALSELMLALSVSMKILSTGMVSPTAMISAALMVAIIGLLAGILYLIKDMPVENTLANATALSALLLALSAACLILSAVGATGPAAFIGIGALATLIAGMGTLFVAIGALMDSFPKLEEFLDKGIPVVEKIGHAIGSFFGNIVGGFAEGVTSGLPGIGKNLSEFMTNLQPFLEGSKKIEPSAMEGIKMLAETILVLTGANILDGISKWITGGSSIDKFSEQLPKLAKGIMGFQKETNGLDPEKIKNSAEAVKALSDVAQNMPKQGGLAQLLLGVQDVGSFGTQLESLGAGLAAYAQQVSGIDSNALQSIQTSAEIARSLSDVASNMPKQGGWIQAIFGEQDVSSFGTQLEGLGKGILSYANKVSAINPDAIQGVQTSVDIAKGLSDVASNMPKQGGWLQAIFGKQDASVFGAQLSALGEGISAYATEVAGITNTEEVTASVDVVKALAEIASNVPEEGLLQKFLGGKGLGDLASKLGDLGEGIKSFCENLGDGINAESAAKAAEAGISLTKMLQNMKGLDASGATAFTTAMNAIAKASIKDVIDKFSAATEQMKTVGTDFIKNLASGLSGDSTVVNDAVKNIIDSMIKSIDGRQEDFSKSGESLGENLGTGIGDAEKSVTSAVSTLATNAAKGANSAKSAFTEAGANAALGFAQGISNNSSAAINAAISLAQSAVNAAKKTLDVHSPSRVMRKIGGYTGKGFVYGINDWSGRVYDAGRNMANKARKGVNSAIDKVNDMLGGDLNFNPTITPVVDLSNVKSGARSISNMLDFNPTVGTYDRARMVGNVRSRQNNNSDIVSALKDLKQSVVNNAGNTYVIDGITYDDGSNVSSAVQELIRHTRIERRV